MVLKLDPPPPSPPESVTDILHGVAVTDRYRWLEDPSSPRTQNWVQEQTVYAHTYLDAIPGRERIRRRIKELLTVEEISAPLKVGDRYFFSKRTPFQDQPVITMREGLTGVDIPLIDPAARDRGSATAVSLLRVSHDGTLLAYSVRCSGEDTETVEIFDVNRRTVLPDHLPNGYYGGLVFSPNNRGFYYSHNPVHSKRPHYHAVRWHTLAE